LKKERKELRALLKSPEQQSAAMTTELREVKKSFSGKGGLGQRRTEMSDEVVDDDIAMDDLVEKEPVTVVISQKGWCRALKGHIDDLSTIKYKDGDKGKFVVPAMTSDRILIFATNGKSYTVQVNELPGGRGQGEPIRLLVDMGAGDEVVHVLVASEDRTFLLVSSAGHGLFIAEADTVANTRKGKQLLNLADGAELKVARAFDAAPGPKDYVASVTSNRRLLIFPASDLPTMSRGKGVVLQRSAKASLVDAVLVDPKEGLTWTDRAGREQREATWKKWIGKRGAAGSTVPKGFPRNLSFGGVPSA
ncbi:MAG: DNA gyrase C-terminal beta-propeller domain-containing protein, partial [Pseudomonadota bacterium]